MSVEAVLTRPPEFRIFSVPFLLYYFSAPYAARVSRNRQSGDKALCRKQHTERLISELNLGARLSFNRGSLVLQVDPGTVVRTFAPVILLLVSSQDSGLDRQPTPAAGVE